MRCCDRSCSKWYSNTKQHQQSLCVWDHLIKYSYFFIVLINISCYVYMPKYRFHYRLTKKKKKGIKSKSSQKLKDNNIMCMCFFFYCFFIVIAASSILQHNNNNTKYTQAIHIPCTKQEHTQGYTHTQQNNIK